MKADVDQFEDVEVKNNFQDSDQEYDNSDTSIDIGSSKIALEYANKTNNKNAGVDQLEDVEVGDNYQETSIDAERKYEAVADHLANVDVQYMKQLDTEREKGRAHMLKMRMQKRDCVSKVGSLQRKLRERSGVLKALVEKVAKLEWAEEDVNELAEEIIQSRELLKLKIALLQFQLKHQQKEENKNKMVRKA
uniref:Uncharacterized protein n=1 Tax=Caenorhabditis japonica TaxID=281687 RepID=A0A8R1HMC2_CAEJA